MKKMMESLNQDLAKSMQPFMEHLRATQPRIDFATLFPAERVIEEREPDETLIEQAQRLRWIEPSATGAGLVLSGLGRALLPNDADLTTASEITVLDGNDPLAWGALVATIADAGACVIVDPYEAGAVPRDREVHRHHPRRPAPPQQCEWTDPMADVPGAPGCGS